MGVSLKVGTVAFEIGTPAFLYSFFSTVCVRLEEGKWGSYFPTIMKDFYSGKILNSQASQALKELEQIRSLLSQLPPEQVVWDFEKRDLQPPWGNKISSQITSLENYFVTSNGKNLLDVFTNAIELSHRTKKDVQVA